MHQPLFFTAITYLTLSYPINQLICWFNKLHVNVDYSILSSLNAEQNTFKVSGRVILSRDFLFLKFSKTVLFSPKTEL